MLESIALTQPTCPAPVVPATSRWGIFARSAPIAWPRDVLAEPDRERRPVRRRVLEDVAELHDPPRALGTSTPTACLPGIGARIRMSVAASA
jgi:hypothetical protein